MHRSCWLIWTWLVYGLVVSSAVLGAEKPNILWVTSEDHGPEMGCYGDALARTPNIDRLAARGMIFRKAWSVCPVCAPARSVIISGLYTSSSGAQHMRSMVPIDKNVRLYPEFLKEAGYYCTNNSKEDYNVVKPARLWAESSGKAHWRNRGKDQPFFAIFNSTKSHESQIRTRPHDKITDPSRVRVPEYHPDNETVRLDWAQYYDKVSEADADAGKRLQEVADAGLADDTIVFYYGDHGSGMPRSKRWPCNSGLHVPMVVYFPDKWKHLAPKEYQSGGVSNRLVSFIDLAPTLLSIAGIQPPEWMQGHAFAGPHQAQPPDYLYGERGRMDERMDLVRSVTDGRFVYLRNYFPHVSQAQHVTYQFETPTTRVWKSLFDQGQTSDAQSVFWRVPKAPEELYDLQSDRDEVHNLAKNPSHRATLERFRKANRDHIMAIRDVCFLPELELHTRAPGVAPYTLARDAARYPLEQILHAAEVASSLDDNASSELADFMRNSDSAVRWWGVLGHRMRGPGAVEQHLDLLKTALKDSSICVRIAAAEVLGLYGPADRRDEALDVLKTLAPPTPNGVLVSMSALAAIETLGTKASVLKPFVANIDPKGPSPDPRYNSYVPRLIKNVAPEANVSTNE